MDFICVVTTDTKVAWLKSIYDGIKFLHSCQIAHRDIKPENILVNEWGVKLGDFGLCELMGDDMRLKINSKAGSEHYAAPEVLYTNEYVRGDLADMWSFSVTVFAVLTGKLPYTMKNLAMINHNKCDIPFEKLYGFNGLPDTVQTFMKRNLRMQPDMRSCFWEE